MKHLDRYRGLPIEYISFDVIIFLVRKKIMRSELKPLAVALAFAAGAATDYAMNKMTTSPEPPARVGSVDPCLDNPLAQASFSKTLESRIEELESSVRQERVDLSMIRKELDQRPQKDSSLGLSDQVSEDLKQNERKLAYTAMQSTLSISFTATYDYNGRGSGVLVEDPSGECYVITCAHIFNNIDCSKKIDIADFHGNSLEPTEIIRCSRYDVAVIKVSNTGDAVPVKGIGEFCVGDKLVGSGFPFGYYSMYGATVSSANPQYLLVHDTGAVELLKENELPVTTVIEHCQISAPVDPGCSGGPLFNQDGKLVGIASAVRNDSRGISFLMPADIVVSIANQLFSAGKFNMPSLDIGVEELSNEQKEKLPRFYPTKNYLGKNSSFEPALYISSVGPEAKKAGLQVGDVIVGIAADYPVPRVDDINIGTVNGEVYNVSSSKGDFAETALSLFCGVCNVSSSEGDFASTLLRVPMGSNVKVLVIREKGPNFEGMASGPLKIKPGDPIPTSMVCDENGGLP